jgi:hypothetical protein
MVLEVPAAGAPAAGAPAAENRRILGACHSLQYIVLNLPVGVPNGKDTNQQKYKFEHYLGAPNYTCYICQHKTANHDYADTA